MVGSDRPLEITCHAQQRTRGREGTQSSGVYLKPDRTVDATFHADLGALGVINFTGPSLTGTDETDGTPHPDTLNGNYGAITHLQIHVEPGTVKRFMLVMVPRGGPAATVVNGASCLAGTAEGTAIFNEPVTAARTFTSTSR